MSLLFIVFTTCQGVHVSVISHNNSDHIIWDGGLENFLLVGECSTNASAEWMSIRWYIIKSWRRRPEELDPRVLWDIVLFFFFLWIESSLKFFYELKITRSLSLYHQSLLLNLRYLCSWKFGALAMEELDRILFWSL